MRIGQQTITINKKKWDFVNQHLTSRQTSYIPHTTSRTSHILNNPHFEHSTSRTSQISNIPDREHLTSRTFHIPNISHPEHPTSWTSHIFNIPHLQYPANQTSHIPSQHTTSPTFHITRILSSLSTNIRIHAGLSLNIHSTIFEFITDGQQSKLNTHSFIV